MDKYASVKRALIVKIELFVNFRYWRKVAMPAVREFFRSSIKSRRTADAVVRLGLTQSGTIGGELLFHP